MPKHLQIGLTKVKAIPGGVVHELPSDLKKALLANSDALATWENITPWRIMNIYAGLSQLKKRKQGING